MLKFLKSLVPSMPATRRIVHDPELGYSAQIFAPLGWQCIRADGTLGSFSDHAVSFPEYWVKTEALAGERINRYATSRGQKIVWTG